MAIDREDVEKIIAGVVGVGVVGLGIAALIEAVVDGGESYVPTYGSNNAGNTSDSDDDDDDDDFYEYTSVPSEDDLFEEDRIIRQEMDSMWDEQQADQMWYEYQNGVFRQRDAGRDYQSAQQEFDAKSNGYQTEFIYIDFTQNLKSGSFRNRNDVYQESIEDQFEKVKRKLALYGKNDMVDLCEFVNHCFPMMKSAYYVSLPSFERRIESASNYQGMDCIYNMVLRPEKTGVISSIIPKELDVILVGDLVFRNNLISFVVKGLDLIDENVEKFGELRIECAAAYAVTKNSRNLPDYRIEARNLYKPFLTRDMVLSLCEKVYPIENPERAIEVFEKWKKYVDFRSYFLNVQSQRNECVQGIELIKAYAVSRSDYRKNEDIYEQHLLDHNKNFIQREQVLLSEANDDTVEFPLVRVEIVRNLAEISKSMSRDKKITNFERELRRFTRVQVALSPNNPTNNGGSDFGRNLIYLGDRIAFEAENEAPNCEDILQFFEKKLAQINSQIDNKYAGIIRAAISSFREKEEVRLGEECEKTIKEYFDALGRNLDSDVNNNTDKSISKRYQSKIREIKTKYDKQRKDLEKKFKGKTKGENADGEKEKYASEIENINQDESHEIDSIPLLSWYEERNSKLKHDFEKSRILQKNKEVEQLCEEKERLLKLELADAIAQKKKEFEDQIAQERQEEVRKKTEQLTLRHFYVYFKAEDIDFDYLKPAVLSSYKYLVYDNRAEKAKIERQKKTLESFYHGYVKNPFLASYLFVPETLGKAESEIGDIEWFGSRLNDSQKEAVRKALASNSLFLLQGPPGTGKTEVIAEITAQYVKQGKKVLVSSETHKAIDNVFDRLPKIPEIRPLRLIPSQSNKDTQYSPEKLVDNLYESISSRLDRRIQWYENFTEMKNNFSEKMQELCFRYDQLLQLEKACRNVQTKKSKLQRDIETIDVNIEERRNAKRPLQDELVQYDSILLCIDRGAFWEDVEKADILVKIGTRLYEILVKYDFFLDLDNEKIQAIYKISLDQVSEEFRTIEENSSSMSVEQEKAGIRSKIRALRDPDTDEIIEGKEEEYEELRKQLISLKNAKDADSEIDYASLLVASFISADKLSDSSKRTKILQQFSDIKAQIADCVSAEKGSLSEISSELRNKITDIDDQISEYKRNRNLLQIEIEQLNDDSSYADFRKKQQELRKEITDFFADFEIFDEYLADDYATAIEIIVKRWNEIELNQETLQQENKSKIPMYKAIREYLDDEEILEEDRISYTKKLFDNANVFGMTCTSREYYSEESMRSLREYKLGNINVRNVGIDIVIIDEVSKSSFLDLMIPILYGKTVILVGDHRQLPPMYDLKHMKKADFDGLDPEVIDYDLNKQYQELYETCFFKTLFERVPSAYKIMLDKQYRCHSDIMDVFNHFYSTNGKGLSVGLSNQNDLKNHDLEIKTNGLTLIEPHNYIYFINCTEYESQLDAESTSIINRQEAEVIAKLLQLMNDQYGKMIDKGTIRKDKKKDERKSAGVICTYRDQARHIKSLIKGKSFTNFSAKREDRLIINTVDDFQGDERDIIIVSMVRNPRGGKSNSDFIKQFERINVALSRARYMLVVVGSMDYLNSIAIDLPDINGNKDLDRHSFPVYREIIRTIQAKGRIIQVTDVLGEVNRNGK
ncbi:AAA domain-containing protein [Peptostreptococcus stomatis]